MQLGIIVDKIDTTVMLNMNPGSQNEAYSVVHQRNSIIKRQTTVRQNDYMLMIDLEKLG